MKTTNKDRGKKLRRQEEIRNRRQEEQGRGGMRRMKEKVEAEKGEKEINFEVLRCRKYKFYFLLAIYPLFIIVG